MQHIALRNEVFPLPVPPLDSSEISFCMHSQMSAEISVDTVLSSIKYGIVHGFFANFLFSFHMIDDRVGTNDVLMSATLLY